MDSRPPPGWNSHWPCLSAVSAPPGRGQTRWRPTEAEETAPSRAEGRALTTEPSGRLAGPRGRCFFLLPLFCGKHVTLGGSEPGVHIAKQLAEFLSYARVCIWTVISRRLSTHRRIPMRCERARAA